MNSRNASGFDVIGLVAFAEQEKNKGSSKQACGS
jgi:hypothetical protein